MKIKITNKTLDYKSMISEIDRIIQSNGDFLEDMECKAHHIGGNPTYSQRDSKEMANILASIYTISHCVHCKACQGKWLINKAITNLILLRQRKRRDENNNKS